MKVLVIAIQKGGQGKTALTCHLAFHFAERGLRVLVIDLDMQANASFTLADHASGVSASRLFKGSVEEIRGAFAEELGAGISLIEADPELADLETLDPIEATFSLREKLDALREKFDICVVDTPPSTGKVMIAGVANADYMASPIQLEAYSLMGLETMANTVSNLRGMNPGLSFLGFVANMVDSRRPRHRNNLAALREQFPDQVMPIQIGLRDSISEALGERQPVWRIKRTAARVASKEVRAVADYIGGQMEIAV
jgi:chromosome partitioning protein